MRGNPIFNIFIWIFFESVLMQNLHAEYNISEISEGLLRNAGAVIRYYESNFEVFSDNRATHKLSFAITIMNEDYIDESVLSCYYDKFSRIHSVRATLYDQYGKKIRNIPQSEIMDLSAVSGFSLYEESRQKYINPNYRTVPFTIEYSYTKDYTGILQYPTWFPNYSLNVAVEKSSFNITVPPDIDLRYYEQNIPVKVTIQNTDKEKIYTWSAANLKSLRYEPLQPPVFQFAPVVHTAPAKFKVEGYEGNMESWQDFGKWRYNLIVGRDALPEPTIAMLNKMVEGAQSVEEKVEILYKYLQNNTRYVSIQEGIGGWQPFEAETVDRLKYGDCKALTNYMKAMLAAVGIPSIYAVVKAGEYASMLIKDFSSNQTNHAFLCIPLESDTIFLECTSQNLPCGYLGTGTDDRDVLLITENGGKIVHTPVYTANDNKQICTGVIKFDADGNANAFMNNTYHGTYYEDALDVLLGDDKDKKKALYRRISIPSFEIIRFEHKAVLNKIPSVEEKLDIRLKHYGTLMGSRLIIPLNPINKSRSFSRSREPRYADLYHRREKIEVDTIIYEIPEGYTIESIPEKSVLNSDFGDYCAEVIKDQNRIIYIRSFRMKKFIQPPSRYLEFIEFTEKTSFFDEAKAVLVRKI